MDKETWTWILKNIDDDLLLHIVEKLKISVSGFRKRNYKKNLSIIKNRLIQEAISSKNILKLREGFNQSISEDERWIMFRNKSLDFLYEYILIENIQALPILLSLMSSPKNDEYYTGINLYERLKQSNQLSKLETMYPQNGKNEKEKVDLTEKINELKSKIKEKNQVVGSKEKEIILLKGKEKDYKDMIEILNKELEETKQLLDQMTIELSEKNVTIESREKYICSLEEEIKNLRKELDLAREMISSYNEAASSLSPLEPYNDQKAILIIGLELNSRLEKKLESLGYIVSVSNKLEEINQYIDYQYIWLIEYQISLKLKHEIQKCPYFERVRVITEYSQLIRLTDQLEKGEI